MLSDEVHEQASAIAPPAFVATLRSTVKLSRVSSRAPTAGLASARHSARTTDGGVTACQLSRGVGPGSRRSATSAVSSRYGEKLTMNSALSIAALQPAGAD